MPTAAASTRCIPEVPSSCPPGSHSRPRNPAELNARAERPCPARKPPPSGPTTHDDSKCPILPARLLMTIGDQCGAASQRPLPDAPGLAQARERPAELGDVTPNDPIWPIARVQQLDHSAAPNTAARRALCQHLRITQCAEAV